MRTKIDKRTSAPFPLRKRSRKREQAVTFWENKSLFDDLNIEVIFFAEPALLLVPATTGDL